jgi:hypothetical protein
MKQTNILYISIILTLLGLNCWILVVYSSTKKQKQTFEIKIYELENVLTNKDIILEMTERDFKLALLSEHYLIDKDLKVFDENKSFKFSDLVSKKPKLFLRYSELNCNTCVDVQLKRLEKIAQKIGRENIIILASYKSKSSLWRFKRLNKIRFNIYGIDSLEIPLEKENTPYYFMADDNLQANMIFVPRKEHLNLTDAYFSVVSKRFFHGIN